MVSFIRMELEKVLRKKIVWIALTIYLLIVAWNIYFIIGEQPQSEIYTPFTAYQYFTEIQGGASGVLFIVLPFIISIVVADSFINERKSSFLNFSLQRITSNKYIHRKILSLGISAFVFAFVIQSLTFLILTIFFSVEKPREIQGVPKFLTEFYLDFPILYCLLLIINSSLMAVFMSCLSIFSGILFKNYYSAILFPYLSITLVSIILMAGPIISTNLGAAFYNSAPLVMSGDYITLDRPIWQIWVYWISLTGVWYLVTVSVFEYRFKKETLL